jgi:hypothetical protein
MSQNRLQQLERSAAVRRLRSSLANNLATLRERVDTQLDAYSRVLFLASFTSPSGARDARANSVWHAESRALADDPIEQALRESAREDGLVAAPVDFAERLRMRLPATPSEVAQEPLTSYEHLVACGKALFGAASFSALLMFASTWVLALANPSFAFAVLATIVSVLIVALATLRFAWETASGAASNPALVLGAMVTPLVAFLIAGAYLTRISGRFSGEV